MGMKQVKVTITGSLSSHNSDQDEVDRRAWGSFVAEVRALADRPEYAAVISDLEAAEDN